MLLTTGIAALNLDRVPEKVLLGCCNRLEAAIEAAAKAVAEAGLPLLLNLVLACSP